ncbi:uncharacterized protein [Temnothorax nylanderi]|uniref:uncharacterized protein n=1 Tax=Temnothorax nylanderi TaxID=102681 RepID=UPI003A843F02
MELPGDSDLWQWNYFDRLGTFICQAKCKECGEKIKARQEDPLKQKLRTHLGNVHGEYPDTWHSELSEELQEYYTGSNECKATCRICGRVLSYLSNYGNLYRHKNSCLLRRNQNTIMQSPIIQISNNQNEPSTSSSTGYITNAERQSQSPPDLPVQSLVQTTSEETGALDDSDTELDVTSYEEP